MAKQDDTFVYNKIFIDVETALLESVSSIDGKIETKQTRLPCDGGLYLTAMYPVLFEKIGYSNGGTGDYFRVPNISEELRIL